MTQDERLVERTIESEQVYQARFFEVRRDQALLPNGRPAQREIVLHPGAVAIAALTDGGELIFERQYRYAFGEVLTE